MMADIVCFASSYAVALSVAAPSHPKARNVVPELRKEGQNPRGYAVQLGSRAEPHPAKISRKNSITRAA